MTAVSFALAASPLLLASDDPSRAALGAISIAAESDWIRLDNFLEAKTIRESIRVAKDGQRVASGRFWLRAGYGQEAYSLLLTEVDCGSGHRSLRFLTIDTFRASGAPIKHFDKQGWTLVLPDSIGRYLTALCDSPPQT
ncbi:MAG TPA: hypothetical protein VEH00_11575 [Steroidobacteraceae bacterium]|nr:hypothetical protein [Steroidobacteraceae bacterium]